ncbi:MAG: acyltransferase domain-containing protein, partial [bacterium]|nr:acyltransferase domain-containing protein [bacterium]
LNDSLSLAAVNALERCVVSGPDEAVEQLKTSLDKIGCKHSVLHTSHAFHSAMMEPVIREFERHLRNVSFNPPQIPYISNVTGEPVRAAELMSPSYWSRHLRHTVRFAQGINHLSQTPSSLFVEVGPGHTLGVFARQQLMSLRDDEPMVFDLVPHATGSKAGHSYLLDRIGKLWCCGASVDWQTFSPDSEKHRIPLPTYPFNRLSFQLEPPVGENEDTPNNSNYNLEGDRQERWKMGRWEDGKMGKREKGDRQSKSQPGRKGDRQSKQSKSQPGKRE